MEYWLYVPKKTSSVPTLYLNIESNSGVSLVSLIYIGKSFTSSSYHISFLSAFFFYFFYSSNYFYYSNNSFEGFCPGFISILAYAFAVSYLSFPPPNFPGLRTEPILLFC